MLKIGIMGKFNEISCLLEKIFNTSNISILLFPVNKNYTEINPHILVFNSFPKNFKRFKFPSNCIILLNSDNLNSDNIFQTIFKNNYIITYGFKNTSNITISSINNENNLMFCIQNNLISLLGKIIYIQEFPVRYYKKSIDSVLVATTIGILTGFEINFFQKIF